MGLFAGLKSRASGLKAETWAVCLAARHPRTPRLAKFIAAGVAAYALSPIDLIPDFIPVIGYLDDLILVPAGIALVVRLVPPAVMAECRARARENARNVGNAGRAAAVVVVLAWLALAFLLAAWLRRLLAARP